ncbi:Inner membrane protein YfdC [compost metagenome]
MAGAVELSYLAFAGPTLAGNIVGGSFIFALISHAQIRSDVELQESERAKRRARQEEEAEA